MTDATIAQTEPALVAIDIAKARHEVLIAVPGSPLQRNALGRVHRTLSARPAEALWRGACCLCYAA
ncbi:hypothetical protein [uncultured Ruegeria sp.]|uniref:hypothetical protein n=1 Tax=uncultured Ruegeria sp. TaxID=259304 RepID=UPI00262A7ED9|nr:hypothetical protein [uncultured Ruegeria sp.]